MNGYSLYVLNTLVPCLEIVCLPRLVIILEPN